MATTITPPLAASFACRRRASQPLTAVLPTRLPVPITPRAGTAREAREGLRPDLRVGRHVARALRERRAHQQEALAVAEHGLVGEVDERLGPGFAQRRAHVVQQRRHRPLRIHGAQPRHVVVGGEVLSGGSAAQLLAAPREEPSDDLHVRSQAQQRRRDDGWIVLAVDHDDGARQVPYRPSS